MSDAEPWPVPSAEDLWMAVQQVEAARRAGEDEIRSILLDLADLADDLDRIGADTEFDSLPSGWREGLLILAAKVGRALERRGASPIAALGERLDPARHRVVDVREGPGAAETIVQIVRSGYLWRGQVLRPADVVTLASSSSEEGSPCAFDRD